jgi:hypothetical protein
MRYSYPSAGTRGVITKTSPCEVYFDDGQRDDGGYSALPCEVNKFGAYACAGHAQYELPASTEFNLTVRARRTARA